MVRRFKLVAQTPKRFLLFICIQAALEKLRSILSRHLPRVQPRGAFYLMSTPRITDAIFAWKRGLPGVEPFYAVKCNPTPLLLNRLHAADIGFDCASERELNEMRQLSTNKIVYANPCKSSRDIDVAKSMGAPVTVVDSVEEVEKLSGYEGGALIRLAVDDSGSDMPFSSKFGASPERALKIADAASCLGLAIKGVSFHVGSGSQDKNAHSSAIHTAYSTLLKLSSLGHSEANIIDIGGGYVTDPLRFWETAKYIRWAMLVVNEERRGSAPPIRWIAEPGRFFAENSFDFFVQVIGKKSSSKGWKYTIDDSLYGQFSNILFDHAKPTWVRVSTKESKPRGFSTGVIFGRTCDSVDVIARAEYMEELEVGDWLWFPSMGAYTHATASEFNGFPKPEIFTTEEPCDIRRSNIGHVVPRGVSYMAPVSARAFWT